MLAKKGPLKHEFPAIWQMAIARNNRPMICKTLNFSSGQLSCILELFSSPQSQVSHFELVRLVVCFHLPNPSGLLDCCNQAN